MNALMTFTSRMAPCSIDPLAWIKIFSVALVHIKMIELEEEVIRNSFDC